jgi:hypothetical protein
MYGKQIRQGTVFICLQMSFDSGGNKELSENTYSHMTQSIINTELPHTGKI